MAKLQPAPGAPRVVGHQSLDEDVAALGQSLSQPDMQRADGLRNSQGRRCERAGPQHDLDALPAVADLRLEPETGHRLDDGDDGVLGLRDIGPVLPSRPRSQW